MIETLKRLYRILQAVMKLLPALIEALGDLADDGQLNGSNKKS